MVVKQVFVNHLAANTTVNDSFLLTRKELRTGPRGGLFLLLGLTDRTGDIDAILWNRAELVAKAVEEGDIVQVRGTIGVYQNRLQLRADSVEKVPREDARIEDYVYALENRDLLMAQLRDLLDTIENEWVAQLVGLFLDDDAFLEKFTATPAGKKWHHPYIGGLLQHTYEVVSICAKMAELFPEIDRDLLLASAFLHDIGKIHEMAVADTIRYTDEGKLLGHIVMGTQMALDRMRQIDGFPDSFRLQIEHAILGHQGEYEQESPVLPKTLEACVLYHADNLDAQTNAFVRVIERTQERSDAWSEYLPIIGRQIWTKRGRLRNDDDV
jgi:3'-5' exoribonuclease